MDIKSPEFNEGETIPTKYSCDGESINPPFLIENVPAQAQSLALIMEDPDAPMGTFFHWVMWNIALKTEKIEEASIPSGAIEGQTSAGRPGYVGPCPPSGIHRYRFRLFALNTKIALTADQTAKDLEKAMAGHIIEECALTGIYERI